MASQNPQPPYVDALNDIVQDGVATVQQMAEAAGCTPQHMRNVLSHCSRKGLSLEAFQRAKDAGIAPRKVADLARGDSCEWLEVTKVGRAPVITEKSIRAYKSAKEGGALKAQNRL